MVEVNWTINALEDANHIAEFIALDSEYYASMVIESFFNRIVILEENSYAGRMVPEPENPFIRELIEGNYRIIYRIVNDQQIDILTVQHSSRLISNNIVLDPLKK
jgi:toxin ParE1/3/4